MNEIKPEIQQMSGAGAAGELSAAPPPVPILVEPPAATTVAVANQTTLAIENGKIAEAWRAASFLPYPWRTAKNQAGVLAAAPGEAGGLMVTCDRHPGRRVYMKPTKRDLNPQCARAAREKICSDLAHDLGVNVPPVILGERANAGSEEQNVACSLVMYPQQHPWMMVKTMIMDVVAGKLIRRGLKKWAAAGLVFDLWVEQPDHSDGHPHNIVFGFDPANPDDSGLIFLDYAWALGFAGRWENEGYKTPRHVPYPPALVDFADEPELKKFLAAVESYPSEKIEEIVMRIPASHLANDAKRTIVEGLVARRSLVRARVQSYGKGV